MPYKTLQTMKLVLEQLTFSQEQSKLRICDVLYI